MTTQLVGSQATVSGVFQGNTQGVWYQFTASATGSLTHLGCRINTSVGNSYKIAIYNASGATKLGETSSFSDAATGANLNPITGSPVSVVSGTDYRIEIISDGTYYWIDGDGTSTNWNSDSNSTYPTFASTCTSTATDNTGVPSLWGEGTAGSPATLSSPTPSGTIGTQATATIGATTDQTSGTFYCVVDSSANLAGVTAAQIKAGQKASGSAALASASSSVSTTTPSAGVTGLTANTAYSYAIVQNNTNGDSNVVTGAFTTAADLDPITSVFPMPAEE